MVGRRPTRNTKEMARNETVNEPEGSRQFAQGQNQLARERAESLEDSLDFLSDEDGNRDRSEESRTQPAATPGDPINLENRQGLRTSHGAPLVNPRDSVGDPSVDVPPMPGTRHLTGSNATPLGNVPPTQEIPHPNAPSNEQFVQGLLRELFEAQEAGAPLADVSRLQDRVTIASQALLGTNGRPTDRPRAAYDDAGRLMGSAPTSLPSPSLTLDWVTN
ncbi:hypothetical protein GQ44DRAFT_778898 [Phaeosphaeriaceae sp. PMI808]|nr:hypothetical protein GQ44DRAFT_778898 [Phaeosphaeriaceae sp. PMI808]